MPRPNDIRERRRALGVSQAEIGIEVSKSQVYVGLVERGAMKADESTIELMLDAIDTIVERRAAVAEATSRAVIDFENRKIYGDGGR
jgi:predicted transcriptional regulator